MRKILLATALLASSSMAFAQFSGPAATPAAPAQNAQITNNDGVVAVKDVQALRDDTRVTLEGNIVEQVGKEKYLFKDATGEIIIEIDNDDWNGVQVTPNDTVTIYGEVDQHRHRPADIEVKHIIKK